jgi:hypothetical protein
MKMLRRNSGLVRCVNVKPLASWYFYQKIPILVTIKGSFQQVFSLAIIDRPYIFSLKGPPDPFQTWGQNIGLFKGIVSWDFAGYLWFCLIVRMFLFLPLYIIILTNKFVFIKYFFFILWLQPAHSFPDDNIKRSQKFPRHVLLRSTYSIRRCLLPLYLAICLCLSYILYCALRVQYRIIYDTQILLQFKKLNKIMSSANQC